MESTTNRLYLVKEYQDRTKRWKVNIHRQQCCHQKSLMTTIVKTHGTWLQGQNLQNCAIKEGANDIKHNQWNYNQKIKSEKRNIYLSVSGI